MNTTSRTPIFTLILLLSAIAILQGCKSYEIRSNYKQANRLLHETENLKTKPFLKAHLKNGDICILRDSWQVDSLQDVVSGKGSRYNFNRREIYRGEIAVPIDSVAIFETNKNLEDLEERRIATLGILTGIDLVVGVLCLTNPKACFGSCPTFYLREGDDFHYADAEGFSNAIAPSLEYPDIDALNNPPLTADTSFSLIMKNEALETHCINDLQLLACPRQEGERVYQSRADRFYRCTNLYAPTKARANEGDILGLINLADRKERFSLADEKNLSSKEEIHLSFDAPPDRGELGLVINFRQSLMTTYFIYSAIGYMGDEVGDIFARIEREGNLKKKMDNGLQKELGDIDIYLWNENTESWDLQGGFYETGPIAINRQILPLRKPGSSSEIRIKIVLNKGLWRIDYVGLTNILKEVEPLEISPQAISKKGTPHPASMEQLNTPDQYLVSMPGDFFRFKFELPDKHQDYELFLYSKGYYLEWMRSNWIKDKNLLKLRQMLEHPKTYLSREAENYKEYEATMEEQFWGSKIDTKTFSYDE